MFKKLHSENILDIFFFFFQMSLRQARCAIQWSVVSTFKVDLRPACVSLSFSSYKFNWSRKPFTLFWKKYRGVKTSPKPSHQLPVVPCCEESSKLKFWGWKWMIPSSERGILNPIRRDVMYAAYPVVLIIVLLTIDSWWDQFLGVNNESVGLTQGGLSNPRPASLIFLRSTTQIRKEEQIIRKVTWRKKSQPYSSITLDSLEPPVISL